MKEKNPGVNVLFVGTPDGMERQLVERQGYEFRGVEVSGFRRSLTASALRYNLRTVRNLITSPRQAKKILREFHPDLVVGTGGYASYPMVRCAARAGVPTAVHESNMVPGLTTKQLEGYADRIMVGFEECRQHYRHPDKIVVTGTPVRGDFFEMSHAQARQKLGFTDDRPLVASFWGSLGARDMNAKMVDFFAREQKEGEPFHHIHAVGSNGWETMKTALTQRGLDKCPSLDVREYIYDMAVVMRAADLVICRAGASTVSEITALAVPAIIVPSPYVTNNHQEKNARVLEAAGGAKVLLEGEFDAYALLSLARELLADPEALEKMSGAMEALSVPDATDKICDRILEICRS
jgi:UDP-N-acetylglucosamine--N-acetylmuramyl-(pentapeptide) pyrophosphoryl-undecaprenol N-acetylglucosamine transferase